MKLIKTVFSKLIAALLLGTILLAGLPCGQALANSIPPKKDIYEIQPNNDKAPYYSSGESLNKKQTQNAKENAESVKEKVVDKLNLDEPLPKGTKKFFKQLKGEEPIERNTPLPETVNNNEKSEVSAMAE